MSPANRASPSASGGRGVSGTMFPVPVYQASTHVAVEVVGREDGVHAGQCQRGRGVDGTMRARGCGLRTKQACSMPGRVTSSTKVPAPVSSRASSTRCTRLPA